MAHKPRLTAIVLKAGRTGDHNLVPLRAALAAQTAGNNLQVALAINVMAAAENNGTRSHSSVWESLLAALHPLSTAACIERPSVNY
jgi:hypothetical protein